MLPAIVLLSALVAVLSAQNASAQDRGASIYDEHCSRCHDLPGTRAPSKDVLAQMSANRIVRTMDFGAMMSVTYILDRAERLAVASWLGVPGEDREPPAAAWCRDTRIALGRPRSGHWNGWSPADTNTRFQANPGFDSSDIPRLRLAWAFGFEGDVNAFAPPAVLGNELFVGSAGGSVYALDAASGCIKWHFQADGPVRTAMLVAPVDEAEPARGHAVMFGDQSGGFYAVDAYDGRLLWRARPESHESTKLTGSPGAHAGIVYVPVASWEESRPLNPAYEC